MQNKMPEGYFLLPKRSFRLLLVLRLTRSIFQWTQFQLSKDFPKLQKQLFIYLFIFTFHNVCGCKWRRWCSRDYRLIHHKCVSIDGGLLSEKTAMGNSVLHHKRFAVPGFNTYATVRGSSLFWKPRTERSKWVLGEAYGFTVRSHVQLFSLRESGILLLALDFVTPGAFSPKALPWVLK